MTLQSNEKIEHWRSELASKSPGDIIRWVVETFPGDAVLASSLGAEDQILTHLIARHAPALDIITLDTGRLFPETHDLLDQTRRHYGLPIKVYFPDRHRVEEMVNEHGSNLFRHSIAKRKQCCAVRKIEPLKRALAGKSAWVTGLRRDQSTNRGYTEVIEWDEANQMVKVNPLHDWTEAQVRRFLEEQHVPYNALHDQGYPSIGCAPCTRAVLPDEDPRAGRWWWEPREHNECGIHIVNGRVERKVPVFVE